VTAARARWGSVIAWGTWAGMLVTAMLFVARYASNVPSWDDWDMIPSLTRNQRVTWDWLWSQHNEHRVPLPRLVFLGLDRVFGVDMRVTMYFDVVLMAALAAALILAAVRLRGRPSPTDAFFPLALLSLGQAANLLWGWQLQFFASVILAGIALVAIVRAGSTMSIERAGVVVGVSTLLLPLCGANGLGMVPALAAWPLALALLPAAWTGAPGARRHPGLVLLGIGALALTTLYFVGWQRVPYHPKSQGSLQTLLTAAKFLTIGLGPAIRGIWPLSGAMALTVLGFSVIRLAGVWRTEPAERARALGLACFIGALTALSLGLGLGRNGFETRYITLAVPVWCAVYFVWLLYPGPHRPPAGALLALAAVAAAWGNTAFGLQYAHELRGQLGGFERDLSAGVQVHQLLHRYGPWLHPHQDMPERYLPMLQRAGVGRYVALRIDTTLEAQPIALNPIEATQLVWRPDSVARVVGPNPALRFRLPDDRFVEGIRLRYRYRSEDGTLPYIGIRWKPSSQAAFVPERFYKYSPTGDRANWERGTWDAIADSATTLTVWVCDTVREIEITPDFRPATFRVDELSLVAGNGSR
jgi:hypothetical protein